MLDNIGNIGKKFSFVLDRQKSKNETVHAL